MNKIVFFLSLNTFIVAQLSVVSAFAQNSQIIGESSAVTIQLVPLKKVILSATDMKNAKPMSNLVKIVPTSDAAKMMPVKFGSPGFSRGKAPTVNTGMGEKKSAKNLGSVNVTPKNYGQSLHPYTQTRVATITNNSNLALVYPYRPTGKLFFRDLSGRLTWCTASAIKPRVIVTAAHCVAAFGQNRYYSDFNFVPGYTQSPTLGIWTASGVTVMPSYLNGSDLCYSSFTTPRGIICQNDVAVLVLRDNSGNRIGDVTGFYSFGWNGYGYKLFLGYMLNQVTQLGYPSGLDYGEIMQRNDSLAYINTNLQSNQVIGSRMNRGSSGGPWMTNFEYPTPEFTGSGRGELGRDALVVTGVTSWGNELVQQMGASPFTSWNIVQLVNTACAAAAGNC